MGVLSSTGTSAVSSSQGQLFCSSNLAIIVGITGSEITGQIISLVLLYDGPACLRFIRQPDLSANLIYPPSLLRFVIISRQFFRFFEAVVVSFFLNKDIDSSILSAKSKLNR